MALASLVLAGGGSLLTSSLSSAAPSPPPPVERVITDHQVPTPKAAPADATSFTEGVAGGYVFVPINPFRTWDSRLTGYGRLPGGMVDRFTVLTDMDNVQRIPVEAVAVTYNLTVDATLGAGYLALYPVDIVWPGNSSINWSASNTTLANGGTVAIGDWGGVVGGIEVYNGPSSPGTHFIVDITGYYI